MLRMSFLLLFLFFSFLSAEPLFFTPEMREARLKDYTNEEREMIEKDLAVVRSVCFNKIQKEKERPIYVATAGAPGARKTTILERFLKKQFSDLPFTYLDPDQRALVYMVHSYYDRSLRALVAVESENYRTAIKNGYEKWRGGSNYITLTLLEEAFQNRQNIAHGTTSTGDHIPPFLTNIKQLGYEVILLLCSCDDAFRLEAANYRIAEQKFYQCTPEDLINKGKLFPQRISQYFALADKLYIFWSESLTQLETLAAIYSDGQIEIIDPDAYSSVIQKYEQDRESLLKEGISIPSWDQIL